MKAKVIKGSFLLTPDGLKKDWGVRIVGNIIEQVGPHSALTILPGDEVLELSDQMILPGFVNGHTHMYGVLSHGISTDAVVSDFSSFLDDFWWPYVEDRLDHPMVQATTAWACVEMIESGITSFVDILEGPHTVPGALEIEREVVEGAGLRGRLSFEACERVSPQHGCVGLEENSTFIKTHNGSDSLVQGLMSIHTLFTGSSQFIQGAKKEAGQLKSLIHMHVSESSFEPSWCQKTYGKTPVEVYEELGFLDAQVLASQVVQVSEEELDILKKRKVSVVTMPLSNCEVGGGFAPVPDMLAKGITVGLGSDGYINNFFEVMRGAFLLHKAHRKDPQTMPAKTVYEMATSMGAKAIGISNTGTIRSGNLADIITLKLDQPTPVNEHNVFDQIVLFSNPSQVTNVMVDGRWLKRAGKLVTIDKEQCRARLYQVAKEFWNIRP